jgi:hypothetical protein
MSNSYEFFEDKPIRSRKGPAYRHKYSGTYNSYSGVDIVAYIHIPTDITKEQYKVPDIRRVKIPGQDNLYTIEEEIIANYAGEEPIMGVLGTLQTISYSTYRDVAPVRSLGKVYATSYTRGPRTIAGSMVWATMDQHVLAKALRRSPIEDQEISTILVDQLPPFNIIITFNNEYSDNPASMGIYGIRMVNEGSTLSIDDILTEQVNTYVAADIDMIHQGGAFKDLRETQDSKKASFILSQEARKRLKGHRNALI